LRAARGGAFAAGTERADGDPLDIVVLSERPITRNEIVLEARVIGGLCIIDRGEADDKIVGVLHNDPYYDETHDIGSLPKVTLDRIVHYFRRTS
jgi:inorganic pyrophosphatase